MPLALTTAASFACSPNLNFDFSFDAGSSGPPPPPPCCCDVPLLDPATGVIPPRPSGPPAATSGSGVLAVSKMYFGDTDRSGQASAVAWKTYGLNIDHKFTMESSTDACTLVAGASCATQLDGNNGVDNSFGANLVPIFGTLSSSFSQTGNAAIEQGGGTMLLRLDGVGSGANYAPLPGALYRAVPTSSPPKWDGSDVRDVDDISLVGADLSQPLAVFPDGYMSQRTWVGAPAAGLAYLDLHIETMPPIPVRHVQIVMNVAPDDDSAVEGTLSGVIRAADLVAAFQMSRGTYRRPSARARRSSRSRLSSSRRATSWKMEPTSLGRRATRSRSAWDSTPSR
jgi:hypothetical protein